MHRVGVRGAVAVLGLTSGRADTAVPGLQANFIKIYHKLNDRHYLSINSRPILAVQLLDRQGLYALEAGLQGDGAGLEQGLVVAENKQESNAGDKMSNLVKTYLVCAAAISSMFWLMALPQSKS